MHQQTTPATEYTFINAAAAGLTVLDTDVTLPDGVNGVTVAIDVGATVSITTGTPSVKVLTANAADYTDAVEITDAAVAFATGQANKFVTIELVRPVKKYLRVRLDRAGASNSIQIDGGFVAVRTTRKQPNAMQSTHHTRKIVQG